MSSKVLLKTRAKKIAVKELWREFQRNLTLVDTIPSIIVDELIVPWDRCRRQLYSIRKFPTLINNLIEFEKTSSSIFSETLDGKEFLLYDSIIERTTNRIMIFSSYRLLE